MCASPHEGRQARGARLVVMATATVEWAVANL